jgi:integrase
MATTIEERGGNTMAVKLTSAAVEKYKPSKARREIADTTTGLHLVIQPSGTKSWALRFRRPDGRPAKLTLGSAVTGEGETSDEPVLAAPLTLGQARELANRIHRERARGVDVIAKYAADKSRQKVAAAEASANTFASACIEFARFHRTRWGTRPRRWKDDSRLLGLRWPPGDPETVEPIVAPGSLVDTWGERPVSEIDGHDVIGAIDSAVRHGIGGMQRANDGSSNVRGRKVHAALSGLFRFLQRRRRIVVNPCAGVWRPGPPPSRDRVLSDDEIRVFWRGCEQLDAPYKQMFRFLLLTGCRRDEVARIRHSEIVGDMLVLPGERVKNHIAHQVPLTTLALEQFASLPVIEGRDLVFGIGRRGGTPGDFSRAKVWLDQEMSTLAEAEGRNITPWRTHDLRRSCASGMQRLGIRHEVIERTLNHVSGSFAGVSGTYQRDELMPERAEALQRWSDHIAGLLADKTNVTPLKRRGVEHA